MPKNPETFGEQFLHENDPKLHTTELVEHEQKRKKIKGEKMGYQSFVHTQREDNYIKNNMAKLFLLRHLKSQWNQDKEFAGWVDNPLSKEGILAVKEVAVKLINEKIDIVYTSPLIRNEETVLRIFENFPDKYPLFIHLDGSRMQKWGNFTDINQNDVPVYVSENLNERYYGKLQGLNKDEIVKKYGEELVRLWHRGYKEKPPGGESLKDVYNRAVPFFKKYVEKDLKKGKNVLLVASHNSLRALVKYIENISDNDIADLELPFGALIEYDFESGKYIYPVK